MKGFFCRLLNLYPGEEKNTFLFVTLAFLWALGAMPGLEYAEALFLIHVGTSSLPTLYTLIPCGMIVLSLLLLYSFHYTTCLRMLKVLLVIGITFYGFIHFCFLKNPESQPTWLWYCLRIFGTLFFEVGTLLLWSFIDQYHQLRDSKRLFALYGATLFLGNTCSGLLMTSGTFSLAQIFLFVVVIQLCLLFWIVKIARELKPVDHPPEPEDEAEEEVIKGGFSIKGLVKSIAKSHYTLLIITGNFVALLLWIIAEFNYLSVFEQKYNTADGNDLMLFMGRWVAIVSFINLIFGLFVYSRVVKRYGFGSLLLFTPMLFLVTFCGWSISAESLVFPLMGFFTVEGSLDVIDNTNFNLLMKHIPPNLKYKIRVIIESLFEPIAMMTSGLILSINSLDSIQIGIWLALVALTVAVTLRLRYFKPLHPSPEQLQVLDNPIHSGVWMTS